MKFKKGDCIINMNKSSTGVIIEVMDDHYRIKWDSVVKMIHSEFYIDGFYSLDKKRMRNEFIKALK